MCVCVRACVRASVRAYVPVCMRVSVIPLGKGIVHWYVMSTFVNECLVHFLIVIYVPYLANYGFGFPC